MRVNTEESCSQRQSHNGMEWSKDMTQAAESIKWRPQQAYGSNQVLLSQPQTIFSTQNPHARIDKRTAGLRDGDCWPAASMLLVASRGRQLSYDVGGVGGQLGSSVVV